MALPRGMTSGAFAVAPRLGAKALHHGPTTLDIFSRPVVRCFGLIRRFSHGDLGLAPKTLSLPDTKRVSATFLLGLTGAFGRAVPKVDGHFRELRGSCLLVRLVLPLLVFDLTRPSHSALFRGHARLLAYLAPPSYEPVMVIHMTCVGHPNRIIEVRGDNSAGRRRRDWPRRFAEHR